MESDSRGVATLTGTVEEGVEAQGQEELHQVQAGAEQNGELPTSPVETPTHGHPSPRTSGNDHLMELLGKAKDACLRKKPGDFSDRTLCGVVRFNHVHPALLQEANDWVEKEWQEGTRSAWHLNCLVYSVAMAVRGKTTNESQPCNHGRKSDNPKGSKRQEGHVNDRKAKGPRFRRLLAWLDVEIVRQQNNNPMTKRQKILQRKLRREFHSLNLNVLVRAREQTLGKLRVWTLKERRSAEHRKSQEQNHLWNTQGRFRMNGNVLASNEAPAIEVERDFLTKIVGTVGKVNKDDPGVKEWLKGTKKRVGRTSSEGPDSIDETKLRKTLKKAKSWSVPGPDGIHTFGGKHSPLHSLPWQMYYEGW